MKGNGLPIISLFTGAGGMDLGVEDAGGDVKVMVESDPDCIETIHLNRRFFPTAAVLANSIEKLEVEDIVSAGGLHAREAALVVGGPPCQPFSKSGYWLQDKRRGVTDPKALMLDHFLRVVREARPEGFIMENVPSLAHPLHRIALQSFVAKARRNGYSVVWTLLHAVYFGVPQTRTRLFVLGLRSRIGQPPLPRPTRWWANGDRGRLRPPDTAGRWIAQFDQDEYAEPNEEITGRYERHLRQVPPGWNYKHHTSWAGHSRPSFKTETRYWSFLLKLSPNRPSWTIQASPGTWTGPFHWSSRRLRLVELAALQTFPHTYRFAGGIVSSRRQVGNAVPCLLASSVASPLLSLIAGANVRRGRRLRYRLSDDFAFDSGTVRSNGHPW